MSVHEESLDGLMEASLGLLVGAGERRFLAIAGAPGSGKSTIAEAMFEQFEMRAPGKVAILPMDGFHYDDAVLNERGRRPWKGAPDTFDVGGFKSVLARLKNPSEVDVAVPVFDRALEISRGSARIISRDIELIIVEGNYLLLDEAPWSGLETCFDLTIFVNVAEAELRRRLQQRWRGYDMSDEEIARKVDHNDMPNGLKVMAQSRKADIIYSAPQRD